ncbi:lipid A deacylase LpxR family protein [Limobrevibacterium gyesilva]|uniref:Lipid A deacylase LpxR family protein n=1 Tax=Limobrevibacterium gyesilva TaxID=2991712 RepID=A0AA41YI01_9PROT|nr:lipid A deacylase LpxR family protein [Limobrevibacterium gyesilva]MCW3473826.1 lipid A deacylase LpxR family protein [Limobrevibacterium gyesilva]
MTHRPRQLLCTAALAGAALVCGPALAQLPPADPSSVWTIQDENASVSSATVTDRYYTNGLRISWASPTDAAPDWLAGVGQKLWGNGRQRMVFDLTQQIYTPFDTKVAIPPPGDRPYAGVMMGTFGLISDTATSRSTFTLGLGMVGPAALGKQAQDFVHSVIGQKKDFGWDTQLNNEPMLQITSSRVWRLKTGTIGNLETEALPELTAGVGTVRVYALTGVTFRVGQGLDADFGVARVRPGLSGGDAFTRTRKFGWYFFAGGNGQAVAHDITLDGNIFQNSNSVKRIPYVGEAQFGFAVLAYGARLSYTQVVQTQEFRHQKGGLHQFGSLALSVRF